MLAFGQPVLGGICSSQLTSFYLSVFIVFSSVQFSSVAQSCPTLCNPMNRSMPGLPVQSPSPRVHSDSRPLSQWCHPAISSSVVPFSSCLQSLPASESFPMSQLFAWGDQSTRVSALASFFLLYLFFLSFFTLLCRNLFCIQDLVDYIQCRYCLPIYDLSFHFLLMSRNSWF